MLEFHMYLSGKYQTDQAKRTTDQAKNIARSVQNLPDT
jgi:hypothetical protein